MDKIDVDSLIFDDKKMDLLFEQIGQNVYELRVKRGLSLTELASMSNLSKSTVYHIEEARYKAKLSAFLKLSAALRVPLESIIPIQYGMEGELLTNELRFKQLIEGLDVNQTNSLFAIIENYSKSIQNTSRKARRGIL